MSGLFVPGTLQLLGGPFASDIEGSNIATNFAYAKWTRLARMCQALRVCASVLQDSAPLSWP
jgi:hypothetical protein